MALAKKNAARGKNGHRYTDAVLLRFAMNSFLLGGRRFYEILHANCGKGVYPCPSTIEKKIAEFDIPVKEGELNLEVLLEFFELHKLPKVVCVSEDATAIVQKREYNSTTNSIMGSSCALQENGLPDHSTCTVRRIEDITAHFQRARPASVVMVVVAQPIGGHFPGIRICAFGSDNRFTSLDVKRRASTIESTLRAAGIEMIGYAADGDSRELKSMRETLQLGVRPPKMPKGIYFLYFCPAT